MAQGRRLSASASAVVAAADNRLRAARDAAANYLHEHAAAAPRMRGIHLYTQLPAGTVLDVPDAPAADSDLAWLSLDEADAPARMVLLIHGLDEPGRVWDDLAPVLQEAGHQVARFDYPNDQAIPASADLLAAALRELKAAGVQDIDIIAHSMGGLIARDVLTRSEHYAGCARGHELLPDIASLIMLGTPNHGSPWAQLQCLSEAGEQVDRWAHGESWDLRPLLGFLADGRGEAARDLLPGSDLLMALNARPLPTDLRITTVVALMDPAAADEPLTPGRIASLRRSLGVRLGDGVVSIDSAQIDGVQDVVFVEASHRGMVRASRLEGTVRWALRSPQDQPPAIAPILERLSPSEPAVPPDRP
jgi:pimeloyl-ACP methyl ester carboxylesterase